MKTFTDLSDTKTMVPLRISKIIVTIYNLSGSKGKTARSVHVHVRVHVVPQYIFFILSRLRGILYRASKSLSRKKLF